MLNIAQVRAISLDLDDTLWPIGPTIVRAEADLDAWLMLHAPATSRLLNDAEQRRLLREQVKRQHQQSAHDVAVLRREVIRSALTKAGDDAGLTDEAFEVFVAGRQKIDLFADAAAALAFLSARFPLVAITNGNADLKRIGLDHHFHAVISAGSFGVGKPDPRIFEAAAKAAGVPVEAVLHVGDDATLDVLAANAVGMQTVWVNRNDHPWTHASPPGVQVTDLDELCALFDTAPRASSQTKE